MQKKIIALAVAGLVSGAAFAQSNVTMYGVADVAYTYSSGDESGHSIDSGGLNGSRIGFKGTEDLGNGLKALFVLEYGIQMDNKDTGLGSGASTRQSFFGLTGNFGTVVAGAAQTAGYDWASAANPIGCSALDANHKLDADQLLNCGHDGRASNAFAYISPDFNGLTFAYNHARVTEVVDDSDAYANIVSATYNKGPISAGLIWSKITGDSKNIAGFTDDISEYGLRGSYDFGVAKVFASWQQKNNDIADTDDKKWQLSAAIPVSAAGTVVVQYAQNDIEATAAQKLAGTTKLDSKAYTLAYTHAMSKRTTLYGGYTYVSNDDDANRIAHKAANPGDNSSVLAVGVRHTF